MDKRAVIEQALKAMNAFVPRLPEIAGKSGGGTVRSNLAAIKKHDLKHGVMVAELGITADQFVKVLDSGALPEFILDVIIQNSRRNLGY